MAATPAPRRSLFRKYAAILMALVGGGLVAEGLIELAFGYQESRQAAAELQRVETRAAADRIGQFLEGIERQGLDMSALPWTTGLLGLDERRDEYHRLMKLVPAISELRNVEADGRERLRVSRSALDEIGSGADLSKLEAFAAARQHP